MDDKVLCQHYDKGYHWQHCSFFRPFFLKGTVWFDDNKYFFNNNILHVTNLTILNFNILIMQMFYNYIVPYEANPNPCNARALY